MKDFLNYYQDELLSLRKKGGAFAKRYPQIAEYIDIKDGQSTDPQTERIIESVAFMSAKLHKRIDDNAENIAFHILNAVYPNLINPLPPCSVIRLNGENGAVPASFLEIKRGTYLSALSKKGSSCSFRTIYPLMVYSLFIRNIFLQKEASQIAGGDFVCLTVDLQTNSVPVEKMGINTILFHINSNIIEDALLIYESIFAYGASNVFLKINNKISKLDEGALAPCGFEEGDSVCPVSKYASNTFQLFQEALHFKQKFMFFTIKGIDKAIELSGEKDIYEFSLIMDVSLTNERLFQVIKNDSLLINCVPIVNLFPCTSDPFRFTGEKNKYLLLADQLRDSEMEIHSVSEIHVIDSDSSKDSIVQPYFSLSVDSDNNIEHNLFWLHTRESSDIRGFPGNDIYLSFIDTNLNPYTSYDDVIYAKLLCTNRFEARDIPVFARLDVEGIETGDVHGSLLYKTTLTVNFTDHSKNLWNLVSQLSATHITLSKEELLFDSIKQLLDMFSAGINLRASELTEQISKVGSCEIVKRFGKDAWRGFVRGKEFNFYSKDDKKSYFSFFLCSIINQYLSSCVSINSFIQVNLLSERINSKIAQWTPTSGRRDVI